MPSLKLTDVFGFVADVQLRPQSAMGRYFKPLPDIVVSGLNLLEQGKNKVDKVASLQGTLGLGKSGIQLGSSNTVDLSIKASASARLSLVCPDSGTTCLFDPDDFADPIVVKANERYISAVFSATVEPGVGDKIGDLKFGLKDSSDVKLSYYQLLDVSANPPTLAEAVESTIANFAIPGDLDDVEAMPANSIAAVEGIGALKFSGAVSLTPLINAPLSASLATFGPLNISAGASISVGAGFELSGEYQIRVQRLAGAQFRLGLYRKRGTEFSLTASAKDGLSAGLGQTDLFAKILQWISADPKADREALAGLDADRVADIQKVVKLAVDRTLNIGVTAEVGIGSETDAMFLYEIDLSAITDEGRPLVHDALAGDFVSLASRDTALPPGIKVVKTVISAGKSLRHSLKINLLGISNFARVSELVLKGAVAWSGIPGELILTDTATASRIGIDTLNFAADPKKLRRVLSELFLVSAAYKVSSTIQGPPNLQARHSYFERADDIARTQMRNDLLLAAAFQLMSEKDALAKLPEGIKHFGETVVLAEACYDDPTLEAVFLDSQNPRNPAEYERAGRDAIQYLVRNGDDDAYRLILVNDDDLWRQMKDNDNVGSAAFAELVRSRTPVSLAPSVVGVDYLNITRWASALNSAAQGLVAIRGFINQHPNLDPNNHDFIARKRDLARCLSGVAARTREDFGGPWGVIAMCLLASRVAKGVSPKLLITNQRINIPLEKAVAIAASAAASPTPVAKTPQRTRTRTASH